MQCDHWAMIRVAPMSQTTQLTMNHQQFNYDDLVLDLHDIALLLNYERGTTEPRFRNTKLHEVADHGADFRIVPSVASMREWSELKAPKTGLIFDTPKNLSRKEKNEPDLPSNMLLQPVKPHLRHLTPKDLELYYWQARNHDGCFKAIALFQYFIELFPWEFTRVRVRVVEAKNKPRVYTTLVDDRMIVEIRLLQVKAASVSFAKDKMYIGGNEPLTDHAVLVFPPSTGVESDGAILDLSSLQFGNAGRGFKGRGTFVLESVTEYLKRLNNFAVGNDYWEGKRSQRINPTPFDDYLKDVACRAKERWEKRATEPWCGHCGAPSRGTPLKRCANCRVTYYCNAEHQLAAWQYHKYFCEGGKAAN